MRFAAGQSFKGGFIVFEIVILLAMSILLLAVLAHTWYTTAKQEQQRKANKACAELIYRFTQKDRDSIDEMVQWHMSNQKNQSQYKV